MGLKQLCKGCGARSSLMHEVSCFADSAGEEIEGQAKSRTGEPGRCSEDARPARGLSNLGEDAESVASGSHAYLQPTSPLFRP